MLAPVVFTSHMNTNARYALIAEDGSYIMAHITKGIAREWMQAHLNTEVLALKACDCRICTKPAASTALAIRPRNASPFRLTWSEKMEYKFRTAIAQAEQAARFIDYSRQPATCDFCGREDYTVADMADHSDDYARCLSCAE